MISEKQKVFMNTKLPRITIVDGCISSGKTFICNHKAIKHIVTSIKPNGMILFVGRTLKTLERNVLSPLKDQLGSDFNYSLNQKTASFCGIKIELEGCNDVQAEAKIRGSTAQFIYGDELTLWNKAFMLRCMGSLRVPGACFLGTTNPDNPENFVKKDFLDKAEELKLLNLSFKMTDNPSLTKEYIEQVSKEYTGVYKDRFINGLWVRAEGLLFGQYANNSIKWEVNKIPFFQMVNVGLDIGGTRSHSTFVATGITPGYQSICSFKEHKIIHAKGTIEMDRITRDAIMFLKECSMIGYMPAFLFVDNAEQIILNTLRGEVKKAGLSTQVVDCRKTKGSTRILMYNLLLNTDKMHFKDVPEVTASLSTAMYDDKKSEDAILDDFTTDVDTFDAHFYSFSYFADHLGIGGKS